MSVDITCYPDKLYLEVTGAPAEVIRELGLEELGFEYHPDVVAWGYNFPAKATGEEVRRKAKEVFEFVKKKEGVVSVKLICNFSPVGEELIDSWTLR